MFAGRVDTQLIDVNVDPNGQVDYMKLNNVDIKQIQEVSKTSTKTYEFGLTLKERCPTRSSFNGKIGAAGSDFNQP